MATMQFKLDETIFDLIQLPTSSVELEVSTFLILGPMHTEVPWQA